MRTCDLCPPHAGLDSDPILFGVAVALADLFPVEQPEPCGDRREQHGAGTERDIYARDDERR